MKISTVILAGGQGSRIGGDKGLQVLHGRPLLAWVLDAIREQSDEVLISANGNRGEYAGFGYPVIADQMPGLGPLAGLQAALHHAQHDRIVSVPCDTPYLPGDLIAWLSATVGDAEAAVAAVEGRRQPAIALYRKSVLPRLNAYLDGGERKVGGWLETLHVNEVVFDNADAFININTRQELEAHNNHE